MWGKIDGEILNSLYKSMRDRIFNLISSKGGILSFKYQQNFLFKKNETGAIYNYAKIKKS